MERNEKENRKVEEYRHYCSTVGVIYNIRRSDCRFCIGAYTVLDLLEEGNRIQRRLR